jgi:hypothetical protein
MEDYPNQQSKLYVLLRPCQVIASRTESDLFRRLRPPSRSISLLYLSEDADIGVTKTVSFDSKFIIM